ncbi:MAG: hypothetical protein MK193_02475 [Lentisphaeria bacterium]|nr:hypothetical protein [Lentisphaeria bacterium]
MIRKLALCAMLSALTLNAQTFKETLNEGLNADRKGKYKEAQTYFNDALPLASNDIEYLEAYRGLTGTYHRLRDYDGLKIFFEKTLNSDKVANEARILSARGLLLLIPIQRSQEDPTPYFEKFLTLKDPSFKQEFDVYQFYAKALISQDKMQQAIMPVKHLDRMQLQTDHQRKQYYRLKIDILHRSQKFSEEVDLIDSVLKNKSLSKDVKVDIAVNGVFAMFLAKNFNQSIEYGLIVEKEYKVPRELKRIYYANFSRSYIAKADYVKALDVLEKWLSDPELNDEEKAQARKLLKEIEKK